MVACSNLDKREGGGEGAIGEVKGEGKDH